MRVRALVVASVTAATLGLAVPSVFVGPVHVALGAVEPDSTDAGRPTNGVRALGSVVPIAGDDPSCPADQECRAFEVTCPDVQEPVQGFIATGTAFAAARGVLVTFHGGIGRDYQFGEDGSEFIARMRDAGITTVQVRWEQPWLYAAPGENAGTQVLACRSASVIAWIHDTVFASLGAPSLGAGRCGFCLTGNSGGASQISYALSHYGLDTIVDGIFPSSGPPHAAMAKACRHSSAEAGYWFPNPKAELIDGARGFFHGDGPCLNHDTSFITRWLDEGVDTGGADYLHPTTRVHFFLGANDDGYIHAHARDYAKRLKKSGTEDVTVDVIPGMGHTPSKQCVVALGDAILA